MTVFRGKTNMNCRRRGEGGVHVVEGGGQDTPPPVEC